MLRPKSPVPPTSMKVDLFARLGMYTPVLLAILFMLPRLLLARFELFDDARTLITADKISRGIWYTYPDNMEGRFRPIHWLWFTLSYVIGGKNPFWFYVSNTIALAVIVAGIIFLVYAITRRRFQATIAGLAFLLSGSVVESFYTLKGEVIQVTFLVLSLLSLLLYTAAKTRWQRIGAVFLTVIILLLAYLVKETTIALLPISAVWYFLERGFLRGDKKPVLWSARGIYLAANLISAPLFFLARAFAIPSGLNQGSYTSRYTYQLSQITVSSLRWGGGCYGTSYGSCPCWS
jgi:uncharacterized membrane protein